MTSVCQGCQSQLINDETETGYSEVICTCCGLISSTSFFVSEDFSCSTPGIKKFILGNAGYKAVKLPKPLAAVGKAQKALISAVLSRLALGSLVPRCRQLFDSTLRDFKCGRERNGLAVACMAVACEESGNFVALSEFSVLAGVSLQLSKGILIKLRRKLQIQGASQMTVISAFLDRCSNEILPSVSLKSELKARSMQLIELLDVPERPRSAAFFLECVLLVCGHFAVAINVEATVKFSIQIGATPSSRHTEQQYITNVLAALAKHLPWMSNDAPCSTKQLRHDLLAILDIGKYFKNQEKRPVLSKEKKKLGISLKRRLLESQAASLGCSQSDLANMTDEGISSWISGAVASEEAVDEYIAHPEEVKLKQFYSFKD